MPKLLQTKPGSLEDAIIRIVRGERITEALSATNIKGLERYYQKRRKETIDFKTGFKRLDDNITSAMNEFLNTANDPDYPGVAVKNHAKLQKYMVEYERLIKDFSDTGKKMISLVKLLPKSK